ncbi:MAG: tetratricopeptide repeat protein [Acidobacteria bacterium]|nr:tetratricopeptide repeat protein [Acidobacteriota bacterium]
MRRVAIVLASAAAVVAASRPLASAAAPQPRPTFNKDIAPIVWARCAPCHRPGEIGPFPLLTYDDVTRRATLVAAATSRRLMPPWKPRPPAAGESDFLDSRRLTDRELQLIQQWIADGAPEGVASDLPPAPTWTSGWQLGPPDLVVRMPEPYTVRASGPDDFRTFVIPIPTERPRYVRALEFHPGNARAVHHANFGVDRTQSSRQLDLKDPAPGYVGGMVPDARYPEGQMLGWTPGQAPHPSPAGMAWRLDPGSDLVAQLHLQPTGKPEPLQISVGLYFTDEPPAQSPLGLRLGSETIDIPAGQRDYIVSDSYVVPVDVNVLAVQPHAHNLARRMDATATLPDGTTRSLIAIDDWDFRWQDVYRYAVPLALPKGTRLSMRYTYDNSSDNVRNPRRPPARVVWGQNTTDEMGDLWIQVVPRDAATLTQLMQDFRRKARAEDLAAYTRLLEGEPDNPLRHDAVAALYLDDGQFDQAVTHLRRSLALNPASASTHYNLGFALSVRGRQEEAAAEFTEALRLDPDYAQAHNNLGAVLQLLGRTDDALAHYRRAIALRPDNIDARANLAQLLSGQRFAAEAAREFQQVLDVRADHAQALAGLAWIRATAGDERLRNPADAVRMAERAAALTSRRDLSVLDALAAAYAAAGRFDAAVAAVRAGIDLAVAAGQPAAITQLRQRLELYQQGQPYRVP